MRTPLRRHELSGGNPRRAHAVARRVAAAFPADAARPAPMALLPAAPFRREARQGGPPYPSARIWAPWNLEMGDHACLSEDVDCYCVDKIAIGANTTVSQYSFLCSRSHDYWAMTCRTCRW
jgi:acetyltransferase-like isoleucine patch superfamily enzyme